MKRIILALAVLAAAPALAQQQQPPSPGMRAWQIMVDQANLREQNATAAALEQADKVQTLTVQIDKTTKERDALQKQIDDAKPKPAETAKPAEQPAPAAK